MPISRKKSCIACRRAKARCNLALPICSRCVERELPCEYSNDSSKSRYSAHPYLPARRSTITNDVGSLSTGETERTSGLETSSSASMRLDQDSPIDLSNLETPSHDAILELEKVSQWSDINLPQLSSECPLGVPNYSETSPFASYISGNYDQRYMMLDPLISEEVLSGPGEGYNILTPVTQNDSPPANTALKTVSDRYSNRLLSQRRPTAANAFLTSKVLIGQIGTYPRMMIQGNHLPPFIHPPCYVKETLLPNCIKEGAHQCLPEILAICASLVQMFYTRTPASSAFVWEAIYKEQARLRDQYEKYDKQELLEAAQAGVVYMLLQALDPESIEKNGAIELIITVGDICAKLHYICNYQGDLGNPRQMLNRLEWVFRESTRRTFLVLFVIEILLDVVVGPPKASRNTCGTFGDVPLPCMRDLWEAQGNVDWTKRYEQHVKRKRQDHVLKIDDLRVLSGIRRIDPDERGKRAELMSDLANWCDGLDGLGTLIWMAATIDES